MLIAKLGPKLNKAFSSEKLKESHEEVSRNKAFIIMKSAVKGFC